MPGRTRWVLLAGAAAAVVAAGLFLMPRTSEVDGVWLVRFEETEGALRLQEGVVYAHCYGANVKLGTYRFEDGVLELLARFRPNIPEPVEYTGAIAPRGEGFEMDRGEKRPWLFQPYTGDCSELATRARPRSDPSPGSSG